jgi:phosphoserine phosphatase
MGVGELVSMVTAGLNHQLGRIEFEELIGKASAALRGRILSDLDEIGERLFAQRIESRIYPEMRELVRAHLARGHTVVLSSSALTIQVAPVAQHAHQQVRNQRRRDPDRGCGQADSVGTRQGRRGAEVRRRERD